MADNEVRYIPGETIVPFQCTPNEATEKSATIFLKVSAGLSVFGSAYILSTIYKKYKRKPDSIDPYQRIMAGLSCYDCIWSFFPWFMGSWLMPAETGHWMAFGNTQTCSLQGFFFWIGAPGAQYYQLLLSLHTLLLVTFGWKPREFHERIERWIHYAIFGAVLILASTPLFFEGYNPECGTCLPAPLPIWCGDWIFWGDGVTECIRGNPTLSQGYYTIFLTHLSIMGVFCTGSMLSVYWTVRSQEERSMRWGSFSNENQRRRQSERIRRTMILYTFGFYACWIVPAFIIHFATPGSPAFTVSNILLPLQGFFNMLVFLAPKCSKYQTNNPGTWLAAAYFHVIFGKVCISIPCPSLSDARPQTAAPTTTATEILSDDDWDDGIGFNDFNEDKNNNNSGGDEPVRECNPRSARGKTVKTVLPSGQVEEMDMEY